MLDILLFLYFSTLFYHLHTGSYGVFEWKRSIHSSSALVSVRFFMLMDVCSPVIILDRGGHGIGVRITG